GRTFQANAYLKAAALSQKLKKSHWVLSDDSGLEVDFLKGAPGIFSARYAGAQASDEENVEKLIDALKGLPKRQRRARFRCVLCLIDCHRGLYYFEGACEGHVQLKPKGASGFGYDPIFVPKGYQRSFAQLGEAVKAELSHRAEAVRALSNFFKKQF
ncbi:MAG: non-canonical purine NTP pyrophosphatase, partial [Puniceicoccaceae bacterium]|nr:non-canonical purine NTP pyrophosphatase [Puniceicoccaceae bacterium]